MRRLTPFKLRRLELDQLQLEVAQRAGMNVGRLSLIENGHIQPRVDELKRLAVALEVPMAELAPPSKSWLANYQVKGEGPFDNGHLVPSPDELKRMARALDVPVRRLTTTKDGAMTARETPRTRRSERHRAARKAAQAASAAPRRHERRTAARHAA